MPNRKLRGSSSRKRTIKCECGAEIVIVRDGKVMGNAIEVHVALHLQKSKNPATTDSEAERIRDDLIAQTLIKASELAKDGS
jgi:hypothetical protein